MDFIHLKDLIMDRILITSAFLLLLSNLTHAYTATPAEKEAVEATRCIAVFALANITNEWTQRATNFSIATLGKYAATEQYKFMSDQYMKSADAMTSNQAERDQFYKIMAAECKSTIDKY